MDDVDLAVRRLIYAHFGRTGRALSRIDLATELGKPPDWTDDRLARLAAERAVVLDDEGEIARALPFSAAPTPFVVRAGSVAYYGNCAWDAFGLAALMGPSELDLRCGDCDQPLELARISHRETIIHFGVPAAHWWDDIGFT